MHESAEHSLIIASPPVRPCLFRGEAVHFYIVQALQPLWVKTPYALYPMLRDEAITVYMPNCNGTYHVDFFCGEEKLGYTFVVG